ncbi:MAG: agmatinase [Thermodesulfobacteriota bacterium]
MGDITNLREKTMGDKVAIIGLPYDEKSSFLKGPSEAPQKIRAAMNSPSWNLWTEMGLNLGEKSIFSDFGDVDCTSGGDPFSLIEEAVSLILKKDFHPIVLGGDHSITYPVIRAFGKRFNDLNILLFDAHPDLYAELDGDRYSHACPFARIMEEKLITRLVQVGIRTMNDHQRSQAEKFGVEVIEMRQLDDTLMLTFDFPLYISFDMDVLDPAFAPGVSHHEPGGLSTRQVINIIHSLNAKVVGADIVELNPGRDPLGITAMTAAKIVKEIAGACIKSLSST